MAFPSEHMPSGIDTMTVFIHQSEFHRIRTVRDRKIHLSLDFVESGNLTYVSCRRGTR